jgi:hypothetical protein
VVVVVVVAGTVVVVVEATVVLVDVDVVTGDGFVLDPPHPAPANAQTIIGVTQKASSCFTWSNCARITQSSSMVSPRRRPEIVEISGINVAPMPTRQWYTPPPST